MIRFLPKFLIWQEFGVFPRFRQLKKQPAFYIAKLPEISYDPLDNKTKRLNTQFGNWLP